MPSLLPRFSMWEIPMLVIMAMSGLANAAVATILVEEVHKYISGDLMGFAFLGEAG